MHTCIQDRLKYFKPINKYMDWYWEPPWVRNGFVFWGRQQSVQCIGDPPLPTPLHHTMALCMSIGIDNICFKEYDTILECSLDMHWHVNLEYILGILKIGVYDTVKGSISVYDDLIFPSRESTILWIWLLTKCCTPKISRTRVRLIWSIFLP